MGLYRKQQDPFTRSIERHRAEQFIMSVKAVVPKLKHVTQKSVKGNGHGEGTHTRMSEFVSLQVVTLEKPHVTHGTSKWLHPYTHTEHTIIQPTYQEEMSKNNFKK